MATENETKKYIKKVRLGNEEYHIHDEEAARATDINDGVLTIKQNGTTKGSFSANQKSSATIEITVPTKPSDIGAPDPEDIKDGVLTLKAGSNTKTFSANSADNITFEVTAKDLGLNTAMRFMGTVASLPAATVSDTYQNGDVILVGTKEYVRSGKTETVAGSWVELGDGDSHALSTVKITAGDWLTGGGDLQADRTIAHAKHKSGAAATPGIKAVGHDEWGHVVLGKNMRAKSGGAHTLNNVTVSSTIPAESFLTSVSPSSTKLGVSTQKASVISSVTPTTQKLVTTSITGVSGSVTASKATEGTAKDIAKVGSKVTGLAVRATTATTVGNANVGKEISITGVSGTENVIKVQSQDTVKTLVKTTDTTATSLFKVTPKLEDNTTNMYILEFEEACKIKEQEVTNYTFDTTAVAKAATTATVFNAASASSTSIYGVSEETKEVLQAESNGTITPYTFTDVTVPKAAASATTVATGSIAANGTGGGVVISVGTGTEEVLTSATFGASATGTEVITSMSQTKNTAKTISGTTTITCPAHTHDLEVTTD